MKLSKRVFSILTLVAIVMSTVSVKVYGNDNIIDPESYSIEGEYVKTQSYDDETGSYNSGIPIRTRQVSGVIYDYSEVYVGMNLRHVATATGNQAISKEFVKYLTDSWAMSSGYTWSNSNTAGWTYGGDATYEVNDKVRATLGLSRTRTTTYGIAITIPANSSKFSKLGFASDYFKQNFTYKLYVEGAVSQTQSGYVKTPTVDTYLIVYYQ